MAKKNISKEADLNYSKIRIRLDEMNNIITDKRHDLDRINDADMTYIEKELANCERLLINGIKKK